MENMKQLVKVTIGHAEDNEHDIRSQELGTGIYDGRFITVNAQVIDTKDYTHDDDGEGYSMWSREVGDGGLVAVSIDYL